MFFQESECCDADGKRTWIQSGISLSLSFPLSLRGYSFRHPAETMSLVTSSAPQKWIVHPQLVGLKPMLPVQALQPLRPSRWLETWVPGKSGQQGSGTYWLGEIAQLIGLRRTRRVSFFFVERDQVAKAVHLYHPIRSANVC